MGNNVFANGREVSCKAADGKSICAFPDVCFTPPETPATPPGVPIPYPNTGMASDTTDGSKKVKISGKEVLLKNKSYFKKSTGDEAGCAAKKAVITSTIQGKVYFNSWSMDVKFEGENVVRHLDLTTHNHMSFPGDSPTWPYVDEQAMELGESACAKGNPSDAKKIKDNCTGDPEKDCPKPGAGFAQNKCVKSQRCALKPYSPNKCCPGQTPHHIMPKSLFKEVSGYNANKAPCVCAEGSSWHRSSKKFPAVEQTHADMHDIQDTFERRMRNNPISGRSPNKAMSYSEARSGGTAAHKAVFKSAKCNSACLKEQIDNYHKQKSVGVKENSLLSTDGKLRKLETLMESAKEKLFKKGKEIADQILKRCGRTSSPASGA